MKKIIGVIASLLCMLTSYAQQQREVEIFFDLGSYAIDSTYLDNGASLRLLADQLRDLAADPDVTITKVTLDSYTSPDGDVTSNSKLSARRSKALYDHVRSLTDIPDSLIRVTCYDVDWSELRRVVLDSDTPYKEEVAEIIDNVPVETWSRVKASDRWLTLTDSRNKWLMDLRLGIPYRYMMANIFPQMRKGVVATIYFKSDPKPVVEEVVAPVEEIEPIVEPDTTAVEVVEQPQKSRERKPLFALKTNLLYDLALTPNLEIEVPIKDRWSIGAQAMYGWWSAKKTNSFAWQIQAADIEGRYWFGDRTDRPVLTGWFAGLFASAGFYDLQLKSNRGVQGDLYVLTGLSGGYSLPLKHNLYLDFAAGVGYVINDYQRYFVADGKYLIADGGKMRFKSIFPAKVEVSLGWLLFNKGGDRR